MFWGIKIWRKEVNNIEKRKTFLINAAFYITIAFLTYIAFKYIPQFALPFLLSFVISLVAIQLAKKIQKAMNRKQKEISEKRSNLTWKAAAIISDIIVIIGILIVISIIVTPVVVYLINLANDLPSFYSDTISPSLDNLLNSLKDASESLGPQTQAFISKFIDGTDGSIGGLITSLSTQFVSIATTSALVVPNAILQILITVISVFFITIDYRWIMETLRRLLPHKIEAKIESICISLFRMIWKFIRSYFFIFLITFGELSIGLFVAKVDEPILIAMLIAIFDIFPIVGAGLIILPWSIISLICGYTYQGIVLLILYIIIEIVRQIIEPKIVGEHVGLKPIISLICMYVGSKLFGVIGLFGFPITAAIIVEMRSKKVEENLN